jgi:hypothetical protein
VSPVPDVLYHPPVPGHSIRLVSLSFVSYSQRGQTSTVATMNIFRILADLSHAASKVTLVIAIHRNSSAEGVSLLTQLLYALVFCARYLDLFWVSPAYSWWNFFFKVFYISSSIYVVYLMMRVYPRTREKEGAWKITTWTLGACVVSAPLVTLVFNRLSFWSFLTEVGRVAKVPAPSLNAHADTL